MSFERTVADLKKVGWSVVHSRQGLTILVHELRTDSVCHVWETGDLTVVDVSMRPGVVRTRMSLLDLVEDEDAVVESVSVEKTVFQP